MPQLKSIRGNLLNKTHLCVRNLIGLWLFNENTGSLVSDLSGNGLTGTFATDVNSPSWFRSATSYDGNDYINLGAPEILEAIPRDNMDFTISVYAYLIAKGQDRCVLGWYFNNSHFLELRYDFGDDYWEFDLSADGTIQYAKFSQSVATINEWVHLTGIRNGNSIKIYVNTIEGATIDNCGNIEYTAGGAWSIGRLGAGNTRYWQGLIDSVAIYNRALTVREITNFIKEPFCESSANPYIYIQLNNPDGAIEMGNNYKIFSTDELEYFKWVGYPDSNYTWDGDQLSWEREITDEEDNKKIVKTYKQPFEIIVKWTDQSEVSLASKEVEQIVSQKFRSSLKGFVWLDNTSGGGEVLLPFTAPHIFIATGDKLNPTLTEINTDSTQDNYYQIIEDKTRVFVNSFSGVGGAAGAPPTLIAHYKMNDNAASATVIDETGNHNGTYKDAAGDENTSNGAVAGKINGALDFDHANSEYVEIADHADFTPAGTPFSISAWVYMHDATSFIIATKGVYNVDAEWKFWVESDDKVYFKEYDESVDDCSIGRLYNTTLTAYENQWIHLVGTSDGGALSSGIRIYLNSLRVDDTDSEGAIFVAVENLAHAVWIGRYKDTYANGLIDNVKFFSVELTQEEVDILYNAGSGTEIPAELDSKVSPRRGNLSRFPLRRRYEH